MTRQTGPLRERVPRSRPHYEQAPMLDLLREHPGRPSREWVHEVGKTLVGVAALISLVVLSFVAVAMWMWPA